MNTNISLEEALCAGVGSVGLRRARLASIGLSWALLLVLAFIGDVFAIIASHCLPLPSLSIVCIDRITIEAHRRGQRRPSEERR